jgi:glycosyltransferase involved in cell wall biosynthesis
LQKLRCRPTEIIVVDNASKDTKTKEVAQSFPGVLYVREDRVGLDVARNTGAKAASRPIVIYTDDDTLIHPDWVHHVVKTFEDPTIMAMTGLVLAQEINTEAQWIFEKFWPFNRGYIDKRFDQKFFHDTLQTGTKNSSMIPFKLVRQFGILARVQIWLFENRSLRIQAILTKDWMLAQRGVMVTQRCGIVFLQKVERSSTTPALLFRIIIGKRWTNFKSRFSPTCVDLRQQS